MGSFSAASYWGCPSSGLSFVQDHLQGLLSQQAIGQFPFVGSFFAVIYWGNPICNPICGVFSCSKLFGMFQKKLTCCQASLHQRGGVGRSPPGPKDQRTRDQRTSGPANQGPSQTFYKPQFGQTFKEKKPGTGDLLQTTARLLGIADQQKNQEGSKTN